MRQSLFWYDCFALPSTVGPMACTPDWRSISCARLLMTPRGHTCLKTFSGARRSSSLMELAMIGSMVCADLLVSNATQRNTTRS